METEQKKKTIDTLKILFDISFLEKNVDRNGWIKVELLNKEIPDWKSRYPFSLETTWKDETMWTDKDIKEFVRALNNKSN